MKNMIRVFFSLLQLKWTLTGNEHCSCFCNRTAITLTKLQALVTLNDEQFVEAARHLAVRSLTEGGDTTIGRLQALGQHVLVRPLRDEELAIMEHSLAELQTHYAAHGEDATKLLAVGESPMDETIPPEELAAWTMLANEMLNLDEVLNK